MLLFDVDGVLTDGVIWFYPTDDRRARDEQNEGRASEHAVQRLGEHAAGRAEDDDPPLSVAAGSAEGATLVEIKGFSAHDGIGMTLARQAGLKTGVITKRRSASLALRARDLRMDYVYQGIDDKLGALAEILKKAGLRAEEAACMGDDIIDLPMMKACGLAAAPANARAEVKRAADWVSASRGGEGAARDLIEMVLKAQGRWRETLEQYLHRRNGQGKGREREQ